MDMTAVLFVGAFVAIGVAIYYNNARQAQASKDAMAAALAAWAINPMNPSNPLGYLYVGGVNFDPVKYAAWQEEQAAAAAGE